MFTIGTVPIQKLFEMIDLSNLTMYGQCLGVFDSRGIIVLYSILNIVKHFGVEQVANDDEPGPSLTSFAMDADYRLFQKVIFNNLQFLLRKAVSVIMTGKAVYDIRFLLEHLLEEQKDVETNVKTSSDRANVMV